jgi:ABC-type multidrug transport system fused ATPase/permease subunit
LQTSYDVSERRACQAFPASRAAISDMGITRIIIAHRQETIQAASHILLMTEDKLQARET